MNLKFALIDEMGQGGQQVTCAQGENKTISFFWFNPLTGTPFPYPGSITELVANFFVGAPPQAPLKKKFSLSQVTLITGNGGTIGFSVALAPADLNQLPVSGQVHVSATVSTSSVTDEMDFPSALNVTSPLVPG